MHKYSLVIVDAYTNKQKLLFSSDNYSEIHNKYKLLIMYRRNLPHRENTRCKRINAVNVNRKISKLFNKHINFINSSTYWYDVLAIKDNQTGLYFSYYRFFWLSSGTIPTDSLAMIEYAKESELVDKELNAVWQNRAFSNLYLKYHNTYRGKQ